ncbi:Gag-pol polyprotein [Caenorhabditis elegans]|uniref:Gag-pol polyprotein n=1 Tax=Caenorhabditis elegans TaxID=6239 RepID=A0A5E4LZD5_CAEEL|nr:Gag-pol polyprotein [Caenorhabditis elegans]VVC12349.1 Gag-pol polyprotein [Caenorhabditis elegans]
MESKTSAAKSTGAIASARTENLKINKTSSIDTTEMVTVEEKDAYDVMVELAAAFGEENGFVENCK